MHIHLGTSTHGNQIFKETCLYARNSKQISSAYISILLAFKQNHCAFVAFRHFEVNEIRDVSYSSCVFLKADSQFKQLFTNLPLDVRVCWGLVYFFKFCCCCFQDLVRNDLGELFTYFVFLHHVLNKNVDLVQLLKLNVCYRRVPFEIV